MDTNGIVNPLTTLRGRVYCIGLNRVAPLVTHEWYHILNSSIPIQHFEKD